jgi:type II secretory pathway component PulK
MPIENAAGDTPAKGFAGTIAGLVQETVEETAGARSIQKIMAEDANVASVLIADPFEELSVNATVLAAGLVATFTPGATLDGGGRAEVRRRDDGGWGNDDVGDGYRRA